jgi:hypothetical protein
MPRKGAKNFSSAASHQRTLFHRERQDKDIFDVTGQGRNALCYYEKGHSFPARLCHRKPLHKRVTDVAAYSSQNRSRLPGAWGQNLNGDYKPLVSRDVEFELTGNTRFKKRETLYTYTAAEDCPSTNGSANSNADLRFENRRSNT